MFHNQIITPFVECLNKFGSQNSFCIKNKFYTYQQLSDRICAIQEAIGDNIPQNKRIGLVVNNDIDTYASIFAIWLNGCCYVPLHPHWPNERCLDICDQTSLDLILDSSKESAYSDTIVILTSTLCDKSGDVRVMKNVCDDDLAYILFTSGSTGKPKGVQISRKNLASFVQTFFETYDLTENDRCLQCFELTFDLSIISYLTPLLRGACVYTVPSEAIKYTYIGGLIQSKKLTFALMSPSTIKYLRPYFSEIDCSSLRYSLFCGEALYADVTSEWSECACNAAIDNVYGPTEDTIYCTTYRFDSSNIKEYNGVLSIGKPIDRTSTTIVNENNEECAVGELGELCLGGEQLTPGYFNNIQKNQECFFNKDGVRWYRSGDLCYFDKDGDIMYSGRLDHQVKIQGFRVEMGEIEYHAKCFLSDISVVCVPYYNKDGLSEIALFAETENVDKNELNDYLSLKIPKYMIPSKVICVKTFPLNVNGKIDKKQLSNLI